MYFGTLMWFMLTTFSVYFVLPKSATPDAPRVAIIRPGVYDPDKYKINDIFSVSILIQRVSVIIIMYFICFLSNKSEKIFKSFYIYF